MGRTVRAIIVGHGPKRNDSAHMPNVATADTTSAKGNRGVEMPLAGRSLRKLADVEHLEDRHSDTAKGRAYREKDAGKVVSSPASAKAVSPIPVSIATMAAQRSAAR